MATTALPIRSIERRMRGGAQSLLVRDGGGNAYIAKCVGNPQGTRTLVNEWIVSRLLKYLRVSTPEVHTIQIDRGIPGDNLLNFDIGNRRVQIAPGVHLGSRCPVDPEQKAIFDFLPRRLLHKVVNLPDLLLAFVFDKWVNQTDTRQAIFIRERAGTPAGTFRTYLIDHGHSFGGSSWEFCDGVLNGLYHDRSIYENATGKSECHAAVDRIHQLPDESILSIERQIPVEWLQSGEREEMTRLLNLLLGRRTKLHDIIDRALVQMGQAGIAIPRTSEGRRLLGALLLLACVPGSLLRTDAVDIHMTPRGHSESAQASEQGTPLATSFSLTARSGVEGAVQKYEVRMWWGEAPRTDTRAKESNVRKPKVSTYFLRVYTDKQDGDQNQVVGEYAFLVRP